MIKINNNNIDKGKLAKQLGHVVYNLTEWED